MLALFSLANTLLLKRSHADSSSTSGLLAFLDDIDVVCPALRVTTVQPILQEELMHHSAIRLHHGKTRLWNKGGAWSPLECSVDRSSTGRPNSHRCIATMPFLQRNRECGSWELLWVTRTMCQLGWADFPWNVTT